jgi:uncharacterized membrane protein YqjE
VRLLPSLLPNSKLQVTSIPSRSNLPASEITSGLPFIRGTSGAIREEASRAITYRGSRSRVPGRACTSERLKLLAQGGSIHMAFERDRPVSELVQDIVANIQQIIRSEVLLAKAELKEEALKASKAARLVAVGGVAALYGLGFLLLFCVYALTTAFPAWASALIVGVGLAIIAAVFLRIGIRRLRQVSPVPPKTVETVKENMRGAKNQMR